MPDYFYTLDIGAHHGRKLSRLAADLCRDDDVEEFAAQLLRETIDRAEEAYRKDQGCAGARVIGAATAPGFDLEFSKLSKNGSGKATLITAADVATPGVLFEIDKCDRKELDRVEGPGYERVDDLFAEITISRPPRTSPVRPSTRKPDFMHS